MLFLYIHMLPSDTISLGAALFTDSILLSRILSFYPLSVTTEHQVDGDIYTPDLGEIWTGSP